MPQVVFYLGRINKRRSTVPASDVSLDGIIDILISVFGGKRDKSKQSGRTKDEDILKEAKKILPVTTITTAEKEAWLEAGMRPSLPKFLKEYRSKK